MRKCALVRLLVLMLLFCSVAWGQDAVPDDSAPEASAQDDSAQPQPTSYDDVATPGQIHGFIPDTWTAGMITLADLQTQEGQDWLNGLTEAQSVQGQTQYVCQNPGPTTTSSDTGDFYFYDLPAGSYAIAACMQTPDGHWRSGAQVISLDAGQNELVALGPAGGPIMRDGEAFVPAFYVGLWQPMWFGPGWAWGWRPAVAWQAAVYYHAPIYRSAPIWVRPMPLAVGARIVVPPYKLVVAGNYHYLAFRNGAIVRESPRTGYVVPPAHSFRPITPAMELRMRVGEQVRPGVAVGVRSNPSIHPDPVVATRPSPFTNYHPSPVNTYQPNNGAHATSVQSSGYTNQGNTYHPTVQNNPEPRPQYRPPVQEAPHQEYHPPTPEPRPEYHPPAPAPRQEYHAPAATSAPRSTNNPKKSY